MGAAGKLSTAGVAQAPSGGFWPAACLAAAAAAVGLTGAVSPEEAEAVAVEALAVSAAAVAAEADQVAAGRF